MGSVSLHKNDRLEELVEGQELKNRSPYATALGDHKHTAIETRGEWRENLLYGMFGQQCGYLLLVPEIPKRERC